MNPKPKAGNRSTSHVRAQVSNWPLSNDYNIKLVGLLSAGHVGGDDRNRDQSDLAPMAADFCGAPAAADDAVRHLPDFVRILLLAKLAGTGSAIRGPGFAICDSLRHLVTASIGGYARCDRNRPR